MSRCFVCYLFDICIDGLNFDFDVCVCVLSLKIVSEIEFSWEFAFVDGLTFRTFCDRIKSASNCYPRKRRKSDFGEVKGKKPKSFRKSSSLIKSLGMDFVFA